MDNTLHALLSDIDDIHLQMHCTIESVRQCYVAMTQGDSEPCQDDYDALYGVYSRLSQLDKQFCDNKEAIWQAAYRLRVERLGMSLDEVRVERPDTADVPPQFQT